MRNPNINTTSKLCRAIALFALLLAPARADIAILPLGDSITFGAHGFTAGYRYPLYINLMQAGIAFHYLGQAQTNCLPLPYPTQWHHDGYPGATIKDMRDNLDGSAQSKAMVVPNLGGYWMTSGKPDGDPVKPDLILLLAGTNNIIHPLDSGGTDLAGMQTQFTDLIGWLTKNRPDAVILIGTVLPITRQPATQNEQVVAFNAWLKSNVASFGAKCQLVDLYSQFLQPDGTPNAKLLGDGVHPNDQGYEIMAKAWSDAITALVDKGVLHKGTPAAPDHSFDLPSGKQPPVPNISNTRAAPATATPGASIAITATLTAGNNALTAPVITAELKDAKGAVYPGTTPATVTLANLAPHAIAPIELSLKLPDKVDPGSYVISLSEASPEGPTLLRFAAKITISAPNATP